MKNFTQNLLKSSISLPKPAQMPYFSPILDQNHGISCYFTIKWAIESNILGVGVGL